MSNTDDPINDIMDSFDFERVHRAMVGLNWYWGETEEGNNRVPTKSDLRKTARRLLHHLTEHKASDYISTGGFVARREGEAGLSLEFVVESALSPPQ